MKKQKFACFIACIPAALGAQITLDVSNAFTAGDRIIQGGAYSTLAPNVVPGNSGPSQTWNFSTTAFDFNDTMNVMAPGWIPSVYTADFPQANLVIGYGSGQSENYDMLISNGSGLYVLGGASDDPQFGVITQEYQNSIDWMRWPCTYGQTYIDTAYGDNTAPVAGGSIDSSRVIVEMIITTNADAWGTLTTSYGTYNTLRISRNIVYNIQIIEHDTALGWQSPFYDTFTSQMYEWWTDSPGIGFAVVTIYVDENGTVTQYNILQSYTTGTEEMFADENAFSVFPSPASSQIIIETTEAFTTWSIVAISGSEIKRGIITMMKTEIGVSELAEGVYTMILTDAYGLQVSRKFLVAH